MANDITGEAEEIRAAIRAGATRQYLERRAAAAAAIVEEQAPAWQQRLDALRARHKEEEARLMAAAYAAIYGEEAIDAAYNKEERAAFWAAQKASAPARRNAWRRAYYRYKRDQKRIKP